MAKTYQLTLYGFTPANIHTFHTGNYYTHNVFDSCDEILEAALEYTANGTAKSADIFEGNTGEHLFRIQNGQFIYHAQNWDK